VPAKEFDRLRHLQQGAGAALNVALVGAAAPQRATWYARAVPPFVLMIAVPMRRLAPIAMLG
jgi:hypothetical protein